MRRDRTPKSPDDATGAEQPIVFVIDDDESMRSELAGGGVWFRSRIVAEQASGCC
jgi:hypothetical protein